MVSGKTTQYSNGFQYVDGKLQFVPTAEGYYDFTQKRYVYNLKDHLGNNRISFYHAPTTQKLEILNESHYYPLGMEQENPRFAQLNNEYKYKYQAQERQDELNLNWDSFKWRSYDYALGRFMCVDPLAEKYSYQSPYNFPENRVIDGVELEGLEVVLVNKEKDPIIHSAGSKNTDKSAIQVYAHGSPRGIQDGKTGNWVNTASGLNDVLNRESTDWKNAESKEGITVVLHSCRTGRNALNKDGSVKDVSFAEKVSSSELFEGVTIVAPDERDYFYGNKESLENSTEVGPYVTINTDEKNADYKPGTPSDKRGQRTDEQGYWNVFKNGENTGSYDGDWTPKGNPGILDWLFDKN